VHFDAVLTDRKHGQILEASRHGFYGSVVKRHSQKQCKNYPKNSRSDQKGEAVASSPPPTPALNTPVI